jgi:hypothetical protein
MIARTLSILAVAMFAGLFAQGSAAQSVPAMLGTPAGTMSSQPGSERVEAPPPTLNDPSSETPGNNRAAGSMVIDVPNGQVWWNNGDFTTTAFTPSSTVTANYVIMACLDDNANDSDAETFEVAICTNSGGSTVLASAQITNNFKNTGVCDGHKYSFDFTNVTLTGGTTYYLRTKVLAGAPVRSWSTDRLYYDGGFPDTETMMLVQIPNGQVWWNNGDFTTTAFSFPSGGTANYYMMSCIDDNTNDSGTETFEAAICTDSGGTNVLTSTQLTNNLGNTGVCDGHTYFFDFPDVHLTAGVTYYLRAKVIAGAEVRSFSSEDVFYTPDAAPVCSVSPTSLNFGTVTCGGNADRTFTITNSGGGTLTGSVSESCTYYSITSGGGSYSLTAGQSVTVTVRFSPTVDGTQTCTVSTGSSCSSVSCTGVGSGCTPVCSVSPQSLDFGTVACGASVDRTFTITNSGGGTLTGSVSESCNYYSITSGGGSYSLTAGQSVTVTVRFSPTVDGTQTCSVSTGGSCTSVSCTGVGSGCQPACSVSPTSLNFGTIDIGQYLDKTFTITNTGGGTLSGTVSESCDHYSITTGGGAYNLTAGQSATVTVRFQPTVTGTLTCSVSTGGSCTAVSCTGVGSQPPVCSVSPPTLDFGNVEVGGHLDKTFTISNTGGGTLTGSVSESCSHYSITSGGGAYSLTAGQSVTVTVRFEPTVTGPLTCSVVTGGTCTNVSCTGVGTPPPVCAVAPTTLDFGNVNIGSYLDKTFTITNTGGGTLTGSVTEACDHYALQSGGGAYSLTAGQSVTVTVRFQPTTTGTLTCSVVTGGTCTNVTCTGVGLQPPVCAVNPPSLDFGSVNIGSYLDKTFTITNTGGGTLTGTVSETCNHYSLQSGGGAYSLTAGQSVTVTVRFAPTVNGTLTCSVVTGGTCANVSCTGVGAPPPVCTVNPTSLDFGNVELGSYADRTFTIANTGGGTLSGTVSETCSYYSITSGGGAYNLTAGQSVTVTVRFQPTVTGTLTCSVVTGGTCTNVGCTGVGVPPAVCSVNPTNLDFGTVDIGQYVDRTFTITNNGGGTLTGTVSESCNYYSITSGGGAYSLTAGQSVTVTVRFQPTIIGTLTCTVATGGSCQSVTCTGVGQLPPACQVNPMSLDFGTVDVGQYADRTFTITNTGGGTLTGNVTESCNHYSITSGGGTYNLTGGQSVTVTVRFQPTIGGTLTCSIVTGGTCTNVSCTGVGQQIPVCQVNPTALDFGTVAIGQYADRTFTITNTGGGTLTGSVTESCNYYSLVSGGGSYSLTGGQSVTVTVRFQPTIGGTLTCSIVTGGTCTNVSCTGVCAGGVVCVVNPTSLDFGNVEVGSYADRTFTITNTGGGTLTGSVTEACNYYSLVSGGGSYSLGAGQSVTVTVRFTPTVSGTLTCSIVTGGTCTNVSCTGVGVLVSEQVVLSLGWVWFTLNALPDNVAIDNVLASIAGSADQIKTQTTYAQYESGHWSGSLTDMCTCSTYAIHMTRADTLMFSGTPANPTTPNVLHSGWNWIPYQPRYQLSVNAAMQSINPNGIQIKTRTSYASYELGTGWSGSLTTMLPNAGFKLKMAVADTLIYPLSLTPDGGEGFVGNPDPIIVCPANSSWKVEPGSYPYDGTVTAVVRLSSDDVADERDVIAAMVGDECRGFASPLRRPDGSKVFYLTAYTNLTGGEILSFRYFDASEGATYAVNETQLLSPDCIVGGPTSPMVLHIGALLETIESSGIPASFGIQQVRPVPSRHSTEIGFSLERSSPVRLEIVDVQGRFVRTVVAGEVAGGVHTAIWDGRDNNGAEVRSGAYFCRLICGSRVSKGKILIVR